MLQHTLHTLNTGHDWIVSLESQNKLQINTDMGLDRWVYGWTDTNVDGQIRSTTARLTILSVSGASNSQAPCQSVRNQRRWQWEQTAGYREGSSSRFGKTAQGQDTSISEHFTLHTHPGIHLWSDTGATERGNVKNPQTINGHDFGWCWEKNGFWMVPTTHYKLATEQRK